MSALTHNQRERSKQVIVQQCFNLRPGERVDFDKRVLDELFHVHGMFDSRRLLDRFKDAIVGGRTEEIEILELLDKPNIIRVARLERRAT
jgi:hypothetical protein